VGNALAYNAALLVQALAEKKKSYLAQNFKTCLKSEMC